MHGHRQPASDTRTSGDQPLILAAARDMGVSIGDTVRVTYLAGGKQISVRVTRDKSDAGNGIIHCETPLAKALLGAEEGEEISVLVRNQVQRARVEEIIRPSLGR